MEIRGIELKYDRTDIDDVERFETALEAYQERTKENKERSWDRQTDRLQAGCDAAAKFLRTAFAIDMVEATGVNARNLTELSNLIIEITDAIMQANREETARIQRLAAKYGNMRA